MRLVRFDAAFGAEVHDLDPADELDERTTDELRQAFDEHGLLLFRDVDGFDVAAHDRLVMALADDGIQVRDRALRPAYVSNREPESISPFGRLPFHTDLIWGDYPFRVVSLYAVELEPPVVPTLFASTVDAWDTLPTVLRARAEGREAVQESGQHMQGEDIVQLHHVQRHSRTTPIGYRHPRTGRTMLFVDQQSTCGIVGLPVDESAQLLDDLRDHMYRPEAVWTHQWRERDLVMWDNLAVQHSRANVEIEGGVRTLRRAVSGAPVPAGAAEIRYGRSPAQGA
jgi:alpha-ketoglutarate-dependent taurine dioxygenase